MRIPRVGVARYTRETVLLLMLLAAGAAMLVTRSAVHADADEAEAKPTDQPRTASLAEVVQALLTEARAYKPEDGWKRLTPDYAPESRLRLPASQVIRGLTVQHDRSGPIDAYVKLQLLSFLDLEKDDDRQAFEQAAGRIIGAQPSPVARELPDAKDRRVFMAMRRKDDLPDGTLRELHKTVQRYLDRDKLIDAANLPIDAYRQAVIDALPEEGGMRLAAAIQQLNDYMTARASLRGMFGAINSLSERYKDPKAGPLAERQALVAMLDGLYRNETVQYSLSLSTTDINYTEHVSSVSNRRYIESAKANLLP